MNFNIMEDFKQKVLENLNREGYSYSQMKVLNPIITATIEATKQALNIAPVVGSIYCVMDANDGDRIHFLSLSETKAINKMQEYVQEGDKTKDYYLQGIVG